MDFDSCLLCDILNGMPTPGGILIDNDRWFAVHSPPRACMRHVLVLACKQHMLSATELSRRDLRLLSEIQQTLDGSLQILVPGCTVRVELSSDRFGHMAWLVYAEENDPRPRLELLTAAPEPIVRAWTADVECAIDEMRITELGGRLPPPAPVPGDAERSTVRALAPDRFCTQCGHRIDPELLWEKCCPVCGAPIRE